MLVMNWIVIVKKTRRLVFLLATHMKPVNETWITHMSNPDVSNLRQNYWSRKSIRNSIASVIFMTVIVYTAILSLLTKWQVRRNEQVNFIIYN